MGLDLNKIINESVSEMKDQTTDTDNTDIETLTEGTDVNTDIDTQTTNVDAEANVNSACLASAISAGLGAMTFRNKLSRLNEGLSEKAKQRLKTAGKVGAGLAAAGAAGAGLYNKFKGNDDGDDGHEVEKLAPRNTEALKREGTGSMYKRVANISKAGQDNDAQGSAAKVAASQSDAQAAENASQGKSTSKNFWSRAPKKVASSFIAKGR
jgi:hypothetical protein